MDDELLSLKRRAINTVRSKHSKDAIPKKLLYLLALVYILSWVIAVLTLLCTGELPESLIRYGNILFGFSFCSYCCKSAYEYKVDKDCDRYSLHDNNFP